MPLYEYRCPACHGRFELLQALGAGAAEAICPACGGRDAERQLSTFAVAHGGGPAPTAGFDPSAGGGCALPQCGGGRCAGGDWN